MLRLRTNGAFTLSELLVTVAIMGIVMSALIAVLTQSILAHRQTVVEATLQDKAISLEKQLTKDLTGSFLLVDGGTDRLYAIDQSYTDANPVYFGFYLHNGGLYRVQSTNGTPSYSGGDLISDDIVSFQFRYFEWDYDEYQNQYFIDEIDDLGSLSGQALLERLNQIHQVEFTVTFRVDGYEYTTKKQVKLRNNLRTG